MMAKRRRQAADSAGPLGMFHLQKQTRRASLAPNSSVYVPQAAQSGRHLIHLQ